MVNKDKKFLINEGRAISNGKYAYGGFPRVLNETKEPEVDHRNATNRFNDGVDLPGDEHIATHPDELWKDPTLIHKGYRYPSKELLALAQAAERGGNEARIALYSHPHYEEFRRGSPEFRNRQRKSDFGTYSPNTQIDSSREGT
jgi:hypothetical protein